MLILLFFYLCLFFSQTLSFFFPKVNQFPTSGNTGTPVFITPFIENNDIAGGLRSCTVEPMKGDVNSYAGFITVKSTKKYNSNMFFWFFPSSKNVSSPVVLWLQGGPGASSLYAVFEENGPFYVRPKHGLKLRKYSWTEELNVLYIDNPVGTGFSFTTSDDGYAKSESDVADNLFSALLQFFTLFYQYKANDFFISGESYAGKYVPALAKNIDEHNRISYKNGLKINLKGISIGNGFCDPVNMMSYSKYLNQIGLIDETGLKAFQAYENVIVHLIQGNQYDKAFKKLDMLINGSMFPYKTLFYNLTGFTNYFNYKFADEKNEHGDFSKFIQSDIARRAIHVGNYTFHTDYTKVESNLINDVMQSVKPVIESLLEKKYRVLIYNGQLDIIVAYPLTVNFLKNLNWSGKSRYLATKRQMFLVNSEIAGYYKQSGNLIEVLIRDAGHMVPKDQPLWALELITRFTKNKPL